VCLVPGVGTTKGQKGVEGVPLKPKVVVSPDTPRRVLAVLTAAPQVRGRQGDRMRIMLALPCQIAR
jgi:hypothetical protein